MEVCVIKPTKVEDYREIADTLLSNCTVVLNLEGLDSGDILLILIILLLLVEGDNLELVITLGLMLILGLGDGKKKDPDRNTLSGSDD